MPHLWSVINGNKLWQISIEIVVGKRKLTSQSKEKYVLWKFNYHLSLFFWSTSEDCVRFSVEYGQFRINFLRRWQFCTHHLLVHFIFSGYAFRFFRFFFVSRILLAQHPKHNFETETKNMKNPCIEVLVDITAINSLIFHSLFLLFCSSHASSGSFKLISPVL